MTLLISLTLAAAIGAAAPQNRPDFSGFWVYDREKTAEVTGAPAPQPTAPLEWTITQTPALLKMVRPWPIGPEHVFLYTLDDRESVNRVSITTHTTRSKWDGDRLIVAGKTVTENPEIRLEGDIKTTLWLTPSGHLVVETDRVLDPKTAASVSGSRNRRVVQVFRKQPAANPRPPGPQPRARGR